MSFKFDQKNNLLLDNKVIHKIPKTTTTYNLFGIELLNAHVRGKSFSIEGLHAVASRKRTTAIQTGIASSNDEIRRLRIMHDEYPRESRNHNLWKLFGGSV